MIAGDLTPMGGEGSTDDPGVPAWYSLIRAARYLGVPPWELLKQPIYWMEWALQSENAEDAAEAHHQQRAEAKQKSAMGRK